MKGFTLIELIVVVAIVAILLIVSLPSYQRYVYTTQRALARAYMLEVMARQEQFFLDHKRYAENLVELGFSASPYAIDAHGNLVSASSDQRIYLIDLSPSEGEYTLRATPQLGQIADRLCGTLSVKSSGVKFAAGAGAAAECW
jgi:type IV pilus assembly protein PilE